MSATKELMAYDSCKSIRKDTMGNNTRFSHSDCLDIQDPTGISNEEGELLYGLIRVLKPHRILETGTNIGVSTAYMALACRDNNVGHIVTIEHLDIVAERARKKLADVGLSEYVTVANCEVSKFGLNGDVDFMWLDTEFDQRYAELVRFFPYVKPGGMIGIHDLCELDNPAYGGVNSDMIRWMKIGILRVVNFNTTSGVALFQKSRGDNDSIQKIMGG
jgi:predicted O-methyltransferase YrrM